MARSADAARFDRRALLLGAGGLLVTTGCSGGGSDQPAAKGSSSPSASASGPIVHEQDAGTVISKADIDDLVGRLNAAVRSADVDSLKAIAPTIRRPVWQQRFENLARYPMDDIGFAFDESLGRQINASGGRLEVDAYMALTHQITGVDSRPALQIYSATLVKDGPDAAVQISEIDNAPDDNTSPAPWDLRSEWDVVEGDHVIVVAVPGDAGRVRASLATIDAGVAAAMAVVPPPAGVTKAYFAYTAPDSPLYKQGENDQRTQERDGFAMRVGYVEPEKAARSGKSAGSGSAYAGARLVLHAGAFSSTDRLREVATHETIHGLAYQWGSADPWPTEGLATWGELGGVSGVRGDGYYRSLIRSGFAGFRQRMRGTAVFDYDVFHDPATESTNYACAAAVYGYLEATGGRPKALRFAETAYRKGTEDAATALGFRDTDDLLGKVQQWVTTI
ncbi:hypothetical protein GCM10009795_037750 [Nocardioides hankookensis]|uniref:Uncharacterized protein n=1 Tax=Nocardioides hankookensis TaxID=443157 RepID=A0ABW1LPY1_9ACTN